MHTTRLASSGMWKAHFCARKMRPQTFHYKHLTLTYGNFQVNRNTIPESSQILSQTFLTFHSILFVNCPSQAWFEKNRVLLTLLSFLRAYWIVSAGPSGHLKQSIQKTLIEQR